MAFTAQDSPPRQASTWKSFRAPRCLMRSNVPCRPPIQWSSGALAAGRLRHKAHGLFCGAWAQPLGPWPGCGPATRVCLPPRCQGMTRRRVIPVTQPGSRSVRPAGGGEAPGRPSQGPGLTGLCGVGGWVRSPSLGFPIVPLVMTQSSSQPWGVRRLGFGLPPPGRQAPWAPSSRHGPAEVMGGIILACLGWTQVEPG